MKINVTPQQYSDLKGSGSVVISGRLEPGKEYLVNGTLKVKCTQWFSDACIKSHIKLL